MSTALITKKNFNLFINLIDATFDFKVISSAKVQ